MDKERLIAEHASQIEKFSGYTLKEGVPKIGETSEAYKNRGSFFAFTGMYDDKTNTIFLDEKRIKNKEDEDIAAFHELAHALHCQNNKKLEAGRAYILRLNNFYNDYICSHSQRMLANAENSSEQEEIIKTRMLKRIQCMDKLYNSEHKAEIEGFAVWLTEKKFPKSRRYHKDIPQPEYTDGCKMYKTIEKAFGFEKTLELAMTPKGLGGFIGLYEDACKKLDIKPSLIKKRNWYTSYEQMNKKFPYSPVELFRMKASLGKGSQLTEEEAKDVRKIIKKFGNWEDLYEYAELATQALKEGDENRLSLEQRIYARMSWPARKQLSKRVADVFGHKKQKSSSKVC